MALKIVRIPLEELLVPELRWLGGAGLLLLFMAVGWLRATRR